MWERERERKKERANVGERAIARKKEGNIESERNSKNSQLLLKHWVQDTYESK